MRTVAVDITVDPELGKLIDRVTEEMRRSQPRVRRDTVVTDLFLSGAATHEWDGARLARRDLESHLSGRSALYRDFFLRLAGTRA